MTNENYRVGDYVTLKHLETRGVVYRVEDISKNEKYSHLSSLKLRPVYGAFGAAEKQGYRVERIDDIVKIDVISVGLEHLKMLNLIKNITEHES